jgi:hypothetical protein
MSKRFRECSLEQPFLLPPCLQDWLPEHHLARFVADVVRHLDLREIYDCYERKDGRGLVGHRHGTDPARLPSQIHDAPAAIALQHVSEGQRRHF